MQVKILSGISGSGKSTYAQQLVSEFHLKHPDGGAVIVSADDYYTTKDNNGTSVYKFDPAGLGRAHSNCFYKFCQAMMSECAMIIVDNTNLTSEEIAPYVLGALAYGYESEILTLVFPALAGLRNIHGIDASGLEAQCNLLMQRKLMPWWSHTIIQHKNRIILPASYYPLPIRKGT